MWLTGAVPMNNNGARNRNLIERNNGSWVEQKEIRDVIVGEVQDLGSSEENEFRINDVAGEVNNGSEGAIQTPAGLQKPLPQGPLIHWERFLPIGSLKVLLVENDDSTRHVVSALLRNCSYEVTAVANGLQAWNILEDLTNHIDLVLTEVVVPSLSGFGLLCKIMSHKTFKNIPVIMMSSHDSMSVAFNCLSKGAADFLVKPIRKNELKNLWQHVWRRCHSSSGSGKSSACGSESGTQTKKYAKPKSNDESENNTGSSDGPDNGSIGLSIQDGSDNGSGTQSSWTKRAAEVDSPQPTSHWDQLADAPDSTCAQVIHTKPETFSNRWVHVTETKERAERDEQRDNVTIGKDLEIGISRDPDSQLEYLHKFSQPSSKSREKLSELDSKQLKKEQLEIRRDNICDKQSDNTANLISAVGSRIYQQEEKRVIDAPSGFSDTSQIKYKASSDSRGLPSLELTLDRLTGVDVGTSVHDNHNILRHSNLSAFSKYSTTFSANQAPPGKVGSRSPLDNSSVTMKREKMHNSNCTPPNQQSNESTNNNDKASTTKCVPKPEASDDKSESILAFKSLCSSGFQKLQYGHASALKSVPRKAVDVSVSTEKVQARGSDQQVQVQHCHHHHHYHHHHIHNIPHQPQPDHDDLSLKNMATAAPQCVSSNMLGEPIEVAAYSVNGSASGSNHGSNGQNGSSNAVNAGATIIEIDNGVAGDSGVVGISGSSGNGADDRHAQRAAALTKFRQKRKERCFEKKVRYQSRKKLAEQRPRVRGQFVRQIVSDDKVGKDRQDSIVAEDNSPDDV